MPSARSLSKRTLQRKNGSAQKSVESNGGQSTLNSSVMRGSTNTSVLFAAKTSIPTSPPNSALSLAITVPGERQVERMPKPDITGYLSSMTLAGRMLDRKLIGRREFVSFEEKMRVRYGLEKSSIYRDHRLLCVPDIANITHCQEVIPWKNK